VANERLRSSLHNRQFSVESFAAELSVDTKTVQRWVTQDRVPHRRTAFRAATLLEVPAAWLWPGIEDGAGPSASEVVAFFPHRSETPKHLWLDLLSSTAGPIWILAYASLFLAEENPESIELIRKKAADGADVRIVLGDPDSPQVALRGREERLFEAIPVRIRMALAYYRPLVGCPGIQFQLHQATLYNSIFRFGDHMLVNQHIFGTYGYVAPILHLQRLEGADLFATYEKSFLRVWEESYAYQLPAEEP